jgi:hypothetical protein
MLVSINVFPGPTQTSILVLFTIYPDEARKMLGKIAGFSIYR